MIDPVRGAKIALGRGVGGRLLAPSSHFMKSPQVQYHGSVENESVEASIGDTGHVVEVLGNPSQADDSIPRLHKRRHAILAELDPDAPGLWDTHRR